MSAPAQPAPIDRLAPEWERVALLGGFLQKTRAGHEVERAELARLESLQTRVEKLRGAGGWEGLTPLALTPLETDVLACVAGPEAEPRIGWMYQSLQVGTPEPYPCRALVQELLCLDAVQASTLRRSLGSSAPLIRARLVRTEGEHPYRPLRLDPWLVARLHGHDASPAPPPGSVRVDVHADWDSLVLPASRVRMLHELLLWIRERETVVGRWGGLPVGGPVALFAGPSGTGKTYAAAVLANDLGWPLFRVDLGRLISKYVGETEKNLNALFDAAHGRPLVLQFDEADSLFAKRGEVREARDRYANMEVSHLLSRIESHDGPCILTTNLRKHLDSAFARRFQVVVDFPRPETAARRQLWERLLPARAPRDPDVDLNLLARAVALTGGGIRNAALHGAYIAAGEGRPIGIADLTLAIWRELAKEGREVNRGDLGPLAAYLEEDVDA